jgi:hypothetical protein
VKATFHDLAGFFLLFKCLAKSGSMTKNESISAEKFSTRLMAFLIRYRYVSGLKT